MGPRDPFDTSTLDAPRARPVDARVATVRVVFRPGAGIVAEPARRLATGVTPIGRTVKAPGIALGDDALVSREHALLHYAPERRALRVEDRGSRNGVHVHGRRVRQSELSDGDVVRMGASFLVVRFEDLRQRDAPSELLLGASPALQSLRVAVKRIAPSDATVLVLGETGTGKEVVARAIHAASGRKGPFVAVNCAAIPETLAESQLFGHVAGAFTGARVDHPGFFRAAERGTIFLDEIGDMPLGLQAKLLRALETREVVPVGAVAAQPFDARVVAATNADLRDAVERGAFRGDLFARLAQLRVALPPLRERREDILLLLAHRLPSASPPLAPELVEALLVHDYPFNVRELFSLAAELALWGEGAERLELSLLRGRLPFGDEDPAAAPDADPTAPPRPPSDAPDVASTAPPDAAELEALLAKHGGNVAAVARATGRSRTQVYRWIGQLGLDPTRWRAP